MFGLGPPGSVRLRCVLDADDDLACMQTLDAMHDLAAGRLVCHPTPGASVPVLAWDLLAAMGKRPETLPRERLRRDGPALARVWLRAHNVRNLVVFRAHLLAPALLTELAALSRDLRLTVWLVWHQHNPPGSDVVPASSAPMSWEHFAPGHLLLLPPNDRADRRPAPAAPAAESVAPDLRATYWDVLVAARAEARVWRDNPPRQLRGTEPACELGATLQRLTADALTEADIRIRLRAAQAGFAAEGLTLSLPSDPAAAAALGPRLEPAALARLHTLVCPTSAAALMLSLLTDAQARDLVCGAEHISPDVDTVGILPGDYRVPPRARPLLRAALAAMDPASKSRILLNNRAGLPILDQGMYNLIRRAADLAGITLTGPSAGPHRRTYSKPFAATFTAQTSISR